MTAMNSCDEQSHFQAKPVLAYVICNRWPVAQFICVSDSNLSTLHFRSGFFFQRIFNSVFLSADLARRPDEKEPDPTDQRDIYVQYPTTHTRERLAH